MTIQIFTMCNNSDLTQVPDYVQLLVITSSETRPKNNTEKAKHNKLDRLFKTSHVWLEELVALTRSRCGQ